MESVYVIVLARYGVPIDAAIGVAPLIRLLMIVYSVMGGVVSLRRKSK